MADQNNPIEDLVDEIELEMQGAIEHFEKQMKVMRTGRATPSILDNVRVEYYGTPTPLNQLAGS